MNSTTEIGEPPTTAANISQPDLSRAETSRQPRRVRQIFAVMRLEIRKNFLSRRASLLYLVSLSPILLLSIFALFPPDPENAENFSELSIAYAAIYGGLILRTLVFFGCAWVFMNLFRGEVVDKSLHYYFLSPVRREVILIGKYLSGLLAAAALFSVTTVCTMLILYFWQAPTESARFFFDGAGAGQLLAYLGVTNLACLGYGAVFLLLGLFFRNPIIPALMLYGWEWINFLLPPLLKKVSVIHYLQSLVPVNMPEGPLAVLVEPTPAWIAVPSLFLFTGVVLFLASLHIRRIEISYAGD